MEHIKPIINPTMSGETGFQLTSAEDENIIPPYIIKYITVSPVKIRSWAENLR